MPSETAGGPEEGLLERDRVLEPGAETSLEYVEQVMESDHSEPLDGSLTNELVETPVDTVLKKYSKRPKMAYVQAAGRIPARKLEYQNIEDRIENERSFREFIDRELIDVPEILGSEQQYVEFEKVEGEDLHTYLNSASDEQAERAGREVGEFLDYLHGRDGAITDLRINNFMVQPDGSMAFVDAEYFAEDASDWEKTMDLITMVSSARQVKPGSYSSFRSGFEDSYGDPGAFTDLAATLTSHLHAAGLETDVERTLRASYNAGAQTADRLRR
ncbi:MAG: hypothetical protein ABEK01_00960 [Candidatus Nanohaloarchaea archaeon]